MSFVTSTPGYRRVVIVKHGGSADEQRIEAEAVIQVKKGYFEVSAPLHEGDVIELPILGAASGASRWPKSRYKTRCPAWRTSLHFGRGYRLDEAREESP